MEKLKRLNTNSVAPNRTSITCHYCHASHRPAECKKFDRVEERMKIIKHNFCAIIVSENTQLIIAVHTLAVFIAAVNLILAYARQQARPPTMLHGVHSKTRSCSISLLRQPFTVGCAIEDCH